MSRVDRRDRTDLGPPGAGLRPAHGRPRPRRLGRATRVAGARLGPHRAPPARRRLWHGLQHRGDAARGYEVVGVDVSSGMLDVAARRLGPDVPLHHHDMRRLPRIGEFDVIWSVSDAVNFLLDEPTSSAPSRASARNLAPGGLVVFDVDTLATFRTLYSSLLVIPGPSASSSSRASRALRSRPARSPRRRSTASSPRPRRGGTASASSIASATTPSPRSRPRWPPPGSSSSPCGAPTAPVAASARSTRNATTRPCTSHGSPRPNGRSARRHLLRELVDGVNGLVDSVS